MIVVAAERSPKLCTEGNEKRSNKSRGGEELEKEMEGEGQKGGDRFPPLERGIEVGGHEKDSRDTHNNNNTSNNNGGVEECGRFFW